MPRVRHLEGRPWITVTADGIGVFFETSSSLTTNGIFLGIRLSGGVGAGSEKHGTPNYMPSP